MKPYLVPVPKSLTPDDHAGRIETWLRAQGVTTGGVTVQWDVLGRARVTVFADDDPGDVLAGYTPTLTADEQARAERIADAQAALDEIAQKPRGARTPTEKALLGLAALSEPVTAPSTPEEPIDPVSVPATDEEAVRP